LAIENAGSNPAAPSRPHINISTRSGKESIMAKPQPAAKFRLGYVTATVWKNDDFFNTVLSKSYKDGDEWKDTDQLGTGDLLNASKLLERAEQFISEQ
jgi:hypothetical protein